MSITYTTAEMTVKEFERKILRDKVEPLCHSQRFWNDQRWIVENMATLLEHYPGQWIAVYDGEIVAASRDLAVTEEEAIKEIDDDEIATFFVAAGNYVY